ncbi:hypothetical protein LINPERPRIM_LOCUS12724 [Linum perenne]
MGRGTLDYRQWLGISLLCKLPQLLLRNCSVAEARRSISNGLQCRTRALVRFCA